MRCEEQPPEAVSCLSVLLFESVFLAPLEHFLTYKHGGDEENSSTEPSKQPSQGWGTLGLGDREGDESRAGAGCWVGPPAATERISPMTARDIVGWEWRGLPRKNQHELGWSARRCWLELALESAGACGS